jgi:DNA modification methylase
MQELIQVPIGQLTIDPANARKHSKRNLESIAASLKRFGQQKPIVIDKAKVVRAGNGTLQAAISLGWETIGCVMTELTGPDAMAYAIADNRTAELAEWDDPVLKATLESLEDFDKELLDACGYTSEELDELIESESDQKEITEDEVPEPPVDPITKPGDLWILGQHRLLCGDSTKAEDVERLMDGARINVAFTSPPYASQREYDQSSGFKPIAPDDFVNWWEPIQAATKDRMASDGSFFVNIKPACEGLERSLYVFDLVVAMKRKWGWLFAEEFCWERVGIPQQVVRRFKNQFEPVYQFTLGDWKFRPRDVMHESDSVPQPLGRGAGNTSAAKRQGKSGAVDPNEIKAGLAYPGNRLPTFASTHTALGHSAAFPVGLPSFFIKAYSDTEDAVYEPFCGSGSTLIAAEQLRRKCYGMEISPQYCDIIVKRWESLTGQKATLQAADRPASTGATP